MSSSTEQDEAEEVRRQDAEVSQTKDISNGKPIKNEVKSDLPFQKITTDTVRDSIGDWRRVSMATPVRKPSWYFSVE